MRKFVCIIVALILALTLIPVGRAPGTPYTVRTHVTLDGSPVSGATVKVTLTKPNPDISGYATYIGGGDYDVNLGNSPYDGHWFNGDPVRVDVTYGGYYGEDTGVINMAAGYTYLEVALVSSNNAPPAKPINPSPSDGAENVSLNPTLSVHVSDPDNDALSVSFYDASDDSLIGTDTNVASGGTASIGWSNLAYNTTYSWYAIADDGMYTNRSSTWHFTTVVSPRYTLTVSISPEGSGSVTLNPDKSSYEEGETVTLTASPNEGYVFDHWSGDADGTDTVKTITVDGDKDIVANFRPIQYVLNTSVEPENAGYITLNPSGGEYNAGTEVTITAVANAGYIFSYWSGNVSGSENPANITMNSNKSVIAHFTPNHPPVVEIVFPVANSTISGGVTIQGKASDADGNDTIQRVEIKIDYGEWHVATGISTWYYMWNTTSESNGNHTIYARAYDGMNYSDVEKINVTVYNNFPPAVPSINGTESEIVNISYTFHAISTDPNNDSIRYGFDWDGDGIVDEWTALFPSGEMASMVHSWNYAGSYDIRAIAEDEHGMKGEWSENFSVTVYPDEHDPPYSTYQFGYPTANLSYGGYNYTAIKVGTPLWINATDDVGAGCFAGVEWLNYSVWWNSTAPNNYDQLYEVSVHDNDANDTDKRVGYISTTLVFTEECFHEIKWQMSDYIGNKSPEQFLEIAVDNSQPMILHSVGRPNIIRGGRFHVGCSTPIWFNITDGGCGGGVGVWKFGINVYWNETETMQGHPQQFTYLGEIVVEDGGMNDGDGLKDGKISYVFYFPDEGFYELRFWAEDYVGNENIFIDRYDVDCTPPESRVGNITPYEFGLSEFNITVCGIHDNPGGGISSGVCMVELYYAYSADNETFVWRTEPYAVNNSLIMLSNGEVENWTLVFAPPDGAGWYRFKSVAYDYLGNKEISYATAECYLNLSIMLKFGEPKHGGWISLSTPINISLIKKNIDIYYRVYTGGEWHPHTGGGAGNGNNFYLYDGNFTLSSFNASHGTGFIEFYANGTGLQNTSFKVDDVPPSTYFSGSMSFLACNSISGEVMGSDNGCGIERISVYYRYSRDNTTWGNWTLAYTDNESLFSFNFSGGVGFYELSTVGTDFLGNEEQVVVKDIVRIFSPDVNGDGRVNVLDIVKIARYWQESSGANYDLDLNGDGIISIADLVLVGQHWTG